MIEKLSEWLSIKEPINIYGRVIDQFDNPVAGAEVIVDCAQFTLALEMKIKSATATTDGEGGFVYQVPKGGVWPTVSSIDRDGYELIFDQNPVMNLHYEKQQEILAVTTPTNPVILKLRKKGAAMLLLGRRLNLVHASARSNQYDDLDLIFTQHELSSPTQAYKDLQASVSYNLSNKQWTVVYMATNGSDGIFVSNDILYEAPETGYQQMVTIQNPAALIYIYLRSRNPVIYSRIDAEHLGSRSVPYPVFTINIKTLTNPYGSRNLEYDVRYEKEWEIKERLINEAKSFLARKQYPPDPDLDALIANQPSTD